MFVDTSRQFQRKLPSNCSLNPLPDMPILSSYNSAANRYLKDMMSTI